MTTKLPTMTGAEAIASLRKRGAIPSEQAVREAVASFTERPEWDRWLPFGPRWMLRDLRLDLAFAEDAEETAKP